VPLSVTVEAAGTCQHRTGPTPVQVRCGSHRAPRALDFLAPSSRHTTHADLPTTHPLHQRRNGPTDCNDRQYRSWCHRFSGHLKPCLLVLRAAGVRDTVRRLETGAAAFAAARRCSGALLLCRSPSRRARTGVTGWRAPVVPAYRPGAAGIVLPPGPGSRGPVVIGSSRVTGCRPAPASGGRSPEACRPAGTITIRAGSLTPPRRGGSGGVVRGSPERADTARKRGENRCLDET